MMIPSKLLKKYGASVVSLSKGELLFQMEDHAHSFFIVLTGKIRMVSFNEEGREFVQGLFGPGESFGEPPFFTDSTYPASAQATESSEVWKIPKEKFLKLLKENFDIQLALVQTLCNRLIYKSTMLSELAMEEAEHRILTMLRYLAVPAKPSDKEGTPLPFTRQQIADMTGLRVETVIRIVKSLEQKGKLTIDEEGKIVWTGS